MLFGLANTPAIFQLIINNILHLHLSNFVMVYLDNILIFLDILEQHYKYLKQVLTKLQDHQLYTKLIKYIFTIMKLEFCDHIISNRILYPIPAKLNVIQDQPQPQNIHKIHQFLGLALYYYQFMKHFAYIAVSLQDLLQKGDEILHIKKKQPIIQTASIEAIFHNLKNILLIAPVVIQPDNIKLFRIKIDASEWVLGCVLMQEGKDGAFHPLAFNRQYLKRAELNYSTQEKELLAIKHALHL